MSEPATVLGVVRIQPYEVKYSRVLEALTEQVRLRAEKTYLIADLIRDDLQAQGWRVSNGDHGHLIGVFANWYGTLLRETVAVEGAIAKRSQKLVPYEEPAPKRFA